MLRLVVFFLLAAAVAPPGAHARAGDPDSSFGRAGALSLGSRDGSAIGGAVLAQGDGGVLAGGSAAGRFVVLRLRRSGVLDRGFGRRGQVEPVLPGTTPEGVRGLATFRDGRIVAAGTLLPDDGSASRFAVFRLLPRGEIDPGFGGGTGFTLAGPAGATLTAMDTDSAQHIVLAGARTGPGGTEVPVVLRLLADGTPDATFGNGGVVDGAALGLAGRATGVVVRRDDSVAFSVGVAPDRDGLAALTAVRLTPAGAPDPGFGLGGVAFVPLSGAIGRGLGASAIANGPTGTLLVAGTDATARGTQRAIVIRLDAAGALDARFGRHGIVRVSRHERPLHVLALARTRRGDVVLAGAARAPGALFVRLSPDGRRPVVRFPVLGRPRGGGPPVYTELAAAAGDRAGRVVLAGSVAGPGTLVRSSDGTRFLGTFTLTVDRLLGR